MITPTIIFLGNPLFKCQQSISMESTSRPLCLANKPNHQLLMRSVGFAGQLILLVSHINTVIKKSSKDSCAHRACHRENIFNDNIYHNVFVIVTGQCC